MELPREIVESLTVCTPGDIIAWHELKSGMESKWGQTYLMLTGSLFFAMTHTSFTDPWTVVKLDPSGPNEIQLLRYEETLLVRDFQGRQYAVQVYDLEREELVAFLDTLSKHRDGLELPALQPPQQPEEPAPQSYAPDPSPQKVAAQDNAPDNAPDSGTIEEVLDDLDALPLDPSTEFVMNKLERLIDKGNEYLQFGTENDPIERLSVFLENFFVRQGERAFREGEKEREYLYKKLTSLRASVSSRLQKTAGTDLSQAQLHDLATHVRTGKLLGKRKATWDQAIVAFEQALLLDPNHFEALTEMAIILSSRGSVSEAKELFSRALLVATTAEEKASVNQQLSLLP